MTRSRRVAGPTAADDTLDHLVAIVEDPRVRLHAMPFAAPRLPALLSGGLATHLQAQWQMGDELVERMLGEGPTLRSRARPASPSTSGRSSTSCSSAGDDDARRRRLRRPAAAERLRSPRPRPPATSFGQEVELLLDPPPRRCSRTRSCSRTVRAAQVVLGELATITAGATRAGAVRRGLALDLSTGLPAGFARRCWRGPVPARDARRGSRGSDRSRRRAAELLPYDEAGFTEGYADDLEATGRRLAAFASVLEEPVGEAGAAATSCTRRRPSTWRTRARAACGSSP